ncbi:MAG: RNA 2',3'-cyclic phosphodiesterase [Parcubacteria group bacterium]|nr:RNA 2',3'-cyclic phosphodiesterase [Parcubacteria group bacterium]
MPQRVFFALNLPAGLRHELARSAEALAAHNPSRRIAWVRESNFHITLEFLGNHTAPDITGFDAIAQRIARETAPFTVLTHMFNCLPSVTRPQVLVLETQNTDAAAALAKKLRVEITQAGFTTDRKPWRGHITLGRLKDDRGAYDLSGTVIPLQEIPIKSFELMESTLTPNGSIYRVLSSYALSS